MFYVFIVMPLLSTIKTVTQGKFSKNNIKTFSDVFIYNTLAFFFSALILAVIFLRQIPPFQVLIYSLITGACSVMFQTFFTLALKNGPTTATIIINNFGIVFTLLTGAIFYSEVWTIFNIVGFLFMSAAFYLIPAKTKDKKATIKWLILVSLSFIFSGLNSAVMLVFSKSQFTAFQSEYMTLTFAFACILSLLITFFNVNIKKDPITLKRNKILPIVAIIIGGALGLYNLVNVIAYKYYPSNVLTPITCGLTITLVMIVNSILNKEKPTLKMLIGVLFAVVAIVLLNL